MSAYEYIYGEREREREKVPSRCVISVNERVKFLLLGNSAWCGRKNKSSVIGLPLFSLRSDKDGSFYTSFKPSLLSGKKTFTSLWCIYTFAGTTEVRSSEAARPRRAQTGPCDGVATPPRDPAGDKMDKKKRKKQESGLCQHDRADVYGKGSVVQAQGQRY